jgi:IS1 family transposase/transposase-like protein
VTCQACQHQSFKKFGTYGPNKIQRYRCKGCGVTVADVPTKPLGSHTTDLEDAVKVFSLFTEGVSVRAISRLTGLHKTTILSLLTTVGEKCAKLLDSRVTNIRANYVQADEAWTFVQKKQKRVTVDDPSEYGDQYVWLALDSESKLLVTHYVGKRDGASAYEFIGDLSRRIVNRCQLTTDGLDAYPDAVEEHFGANVDYAQLIKNYAAPNTNGPDWYRPSARVVSAVPTPVSGDPEISKISTSHIERTNLTLRMQLRRFTRLTNGFSKKLANLKAAVAVFVAWYNFCRVHQTLRCTPAMEAGLTDHVWSVRELLAA